VGCGDHHPGNAVEVSDPERHHRRRQRPGGHQGAEPGRGHDLRRVAGENVGAMPGVEADDHPAAGVTVVEQIGGESGRRLTDYHPVHPVRAGTQSAAEPGRTELEPAREGVGQLRCGAVTARCCRAEQYLDPLPRLRVGVLFGPRRYAAQQLRVQR
jgi:hypothetical protein